MENYQQKSNSNTKLSKKETVIQWKSVDQERVWTDQSHALK